MKRQLCAGLSFFTSLHFWVLGFFLSSLGFDLHLAYFLGTFFVWDSCDFFDWDFHTGLTYLFLWTIGGKGLGADHTYIYNLRGVVGSILLSMLSRVPDIEYCLIFICSRIPRWSSLGARLGSWV